MKKIVALFSALAATAFTAMPALAQGEATPPGKPPEHVAAALVIAAGFSMAFAAGFCGLGQGKVAAAACEAIARNPGAGGAIRTAMILGLVFIETLALFTLVIVFAKIGY
jgi:F-type H+-transporting ATPase subunit c